MVARYLLLFALLALSVRGLCFLYVHIMTNEINSADVRYPPVNHRVSPKKRMATTGVSQTRSSSDNKRRQSQNPAYRVSNPSYSSYAAYRNSSSK